MASMLSIEIDNHNIKLIEGTMKRKKLTICKTISLDLPNCIDDGVITDMELFEKTIKETLSKNNVRSKKTIIIINTNLIIARKLELPYLNNSKEIKSMINIELEQLLAADINEYVFMYKTSDIYFADSIKKATYLVYGLPVNMCRQYIDFSKKMKLQLVSLNLSSNCLDKLTSLKSISNTVDLTKSTVSFIKIGKKTITFSVVKNGITDFSRTASINDYSLPSGNAAETPLKYSSSNSFSPDLFIDNCLDEISKFIRYYHSINKENLIEKIFFYGNIHDIKRNLNYLSAVLNTDTEIVHELTDINVPGNSTNLICNLYFNGILSFYTNKSDINFLMDKQRHHVYKFTAFVIVMASVLIVFLILFYFYITALFNNRAMENQIETMSVFLHDDENIKLNNEIESVKDKIAHLEAYVEAALIIKDTIRNEDIVSSQIFRELIKAVPYGTELKSVTISSVSVQLQCGSNSLDDITMFINKLRNIYFIKDVYIPAVSYEAENNDNYIYSIICRLRV